jgi:hypothetical protein
MSRVYRMASILYPAPAQKKRRHEHWYARAGRPVTQLVVVRTVRESSALHRQANSNFDRSTYNRRTQRENVANVSNPAKILAGVDLKDGTNH